MTEQPVISVRGEARLEVEPEIASLGVGAEARDRDRRTVLDRLTARNAQLLDLIKEYGDAVEKLESAPARVYPDLKYKDKTERVRGYRGQVNLHVVLRDFTVLGELVTRLADSDLVTVAGPWWSLRPDSPVRRQARIAAAQDATRRAGEYAEAFGGQLGGLIEAADTGLLTDSDRPPVMAATRGMVAPGGAVGGGPPALDFEPVQQTVTARVEARFRMIPPDPPQA